ncbi:MAG TPA: hypothetical protein VML55_12215 [Planctomycetaceae bacterium]|nr:hypothetical protein [Planctomycetaceae bacterium]
MLSMLANIATVVFFVAVYVYIATDVMAGGGSTAELSWRVVVPSFVAAIALRALAWLFGPRARMNRRREHLEELLRARR